MQKNYELLYIVHPDLEGSTDKVTEKVTGFITKVEGEVLTHEDWGKRKLAYPIAKNNFGVYVLITFKVEPTKLHEVERDLRLSEEIMRSMVVVLPEMKEVVAKPKKEPSVAKAKLDKKAEAPASIIVAEEKPKKAAKKAVSSSSEAKDPEILHDVQNDKPEKKAPVKKAATKKAAKTDEKAEAERLKKLDEKLDELLK